MFLGEHRHGVDAKGRVIFPVRMRSELGAQVVLQKGIESCLYVLPPDEWERQVQRVTELPTTNPEARRYARFLARSEAKDVPASQLWLNDECRSYHPGWILFAWSPLLRDASSG